MAADLLPVLQQVPLFERLGRRQIESIAKAMKERRYDDGAALVEEGKGGVGFFVLLEGSVVVHVHGEERRRLGPGSHFGEIALIDDRPRTATVTAEGPVRCATLSAWEFRPIVQEHAEVAWALLQTLAARLREAG